jgi:cytochrome c oxidase subunit 3
MAEGTVGQLTAGPWGGGVLPYNIGHKKLGMWLFILSDSLTFSALLIAYSYVRLASQTWPTPFHVWPSIAMATLMTFCLLSSSLTMAMGVAASQRGDRRAAARFILLTIAGGIREGVRLWENPWGVPLFGATFFTLTGLHMLHVGSGLVYLSVIAAGVSRGRFTHEDVEISGLYWHFVDLVWMFIFPLVYLMSVDMGGGH